MIIEMLVGGKTPWVPNQEVESSWQFVKDAAMVFTRTRRKFLFFGWWRLEADLEAMVVLAVKEAHKLQQESGNTHRVVTMIGGLRHIWCNGSFYVVGL